MAAEETRGGFTKSQWEDLIRRLHDPKDPTGNYRSPNPPRFTPGGAGGLKQVKNLMDGLKIASAVATGGNAAGFWGPGT